MKCEGANKNYVSIVLRPLLIGSYDVTELMNLVDTLRDVSNRTRGGGTGARTAAERFDGNGTHDSASTRSEEREGKRKIGKTAGLISVINTSLRCEPKLNYLLQTERIEKKKEKREEEKEKGTEK